MITASNMNPFTIRLEFLYREQIRIILPLSRLPITRHQVYISCQMSLARICLCQST